MPFVVMKSEDIVLLVKARDVLYKHGLTDAGDSVRKALSNVALHAPEQDSP